jgi:type IV secretion system protein VirD4
MSATRILWGQITVVFVLFTTWAATQWTAWRLGFQPQLGHPWFELAPGVPIYLPPAFFWWWYAYDATHLKCSLKVHASLRLAGSSRL